MFTDMLLTLSSTNWRLTFWQIGQATAQNVHEFFLFIDIHGIDHPIRRAVEPLAVISEITLNGVVGSSSIGQRFDLTGSRFPNSFADQAGLYQLFDSLQSGIVIRFTGAFFDPLDVLNDAVFVDNEN